MILEEISLFGSEWVLQLIQEVFEQILELY